METVRPNEALNEVLGLRSLPRAMPRGAAEAVGLVMVQEAFKCQVPTSTSLLCFAYGVLPIKCRKHDDNPNFPHPPRVGEVFYVVKQ